jgi:ADP-ribose pyrophosphatase
MSIEESKEKYRVIDRQLINTYRDGYIGKEIYEVTLNNGRKRRVEKITKAGRNGDAAIIIPVTTDNKYVVIVESRPNTEESVCIEFPAGMVDPGETHEQAAARELLEETGYTAEKLVELEWHYQDQGCSGAVVKSFIAVNCRKTDEQHLDGTENIDTFELPEEEVDKLILNNEINDSGSRNAYLTYKFKNQNKA